MQRENYLLVGLGNPGKTYEGSRHNAGFMVLDAFAKKNEALFQKKSALKGEIGSLERDEKEVFLLKPHTYMNLSGESVKIALKYLNVPIQNMLIVIDDCDLPFGTLRMKTKGGTGGHKGLKSINEQLGTQEYSRLKVGVGRPLFGELESYVLGQFLPEEKKELPNILERTTHVIEAWLKMEMNEAIQLAASFHLSSSCDEKQKELE